MQLMNFLNFFLLNNSAWIPAETSFPMWSITATTLSPKDASHCTSACIAHCIYPFLGYKSLLPSSPLLLQLYHHNVNLYPRLYFFCSCILGYAYTLVIERERCESAIKVFKVTKGNTFVEIRQKSR